MDQNPGTCCPQFSGLWGTMVAMSTKDWCYLGQGFYGILVFIKDLTESVFIVGVFQTMFMKPCIYKDTGMTYITIFLIHSKVTTNGCYGNQEKIMLKCLILWPQTRSTWHIYNCSFFLKNLSRLMVSVNFMSLKLLELMLLCHFQWCMWHQNWINIFQWCMWHQNWINMIHFRTHQNFSKLMFCANLRFLQLIVLKLQG